MHRTGTSLLARMARDVAGVSLGQRLLPADKWNADGYWEHTGILEVHERILRLIDREVMSGASTLPYPARWWRAPDLHRLKCQLIDIAREGLEASGGWWGFKDPRTARLLPLWREIIAEIGADPLYLLTIRDPRAVSASLAKRNGLSEARSQLLWLLHYLDALRYTEGRFGLVADYDRWFTDPQEQVQALIDACGITASPGCGAALAAVQAIVKRSLRHHDAGQTNIVLPFVEDVHTLFARAARTGRVPAKLWDLEAEVRAAHDALHARAELLDARTLAERCRRFLADRPHLHEELRKIPQFARVMAGTE
jgi:hypothetical protein